METGKSALGLDGNVAAALGYPIGIIAIISLIMEKENRFVRFHALQSILLHVAVGIVMIVIMIVGVIFGVAATAAGSQAGGAIGGIFGMLSILIWLVILLCYVGSLIYAAVKAYGGELFKIPILGKMTDKFLGY